MRFDEGPPLLCERKDLRDLVRSIVEKKLDRQASAAGLLIVEIDPFDVYENVDKTLLANAMTHLDIMALNMPVWITEGPEDTIRRLRRLEKRGSFEIRSNGIKRPGTNSFRRRLIDAVPGVTSSRLLDDGLELGEVLDTMIVWEALEGALALEKWTQIHGVGPKTVERVREGLRSPYV